MKHHDPILLDVFRAYGTASNLAKSLGVSRQAVCQWHKVPLKYVRRISAFTGILPEVLRPDIYAEL
jgi:DNA-binding transcriptional regulator YdaS (Cro superfamily)